MRLNSRPAATPGTVGTHADASTRAGGPFKPGAPASLDVKDLRRTEGRGSYAVYPPELGARFERERLDRFAHAVEDLDFKAAHVTWWTFHGEQLVEEHKADARSSRQVLDVLLERYVNDEASRAHVRQSLGGDRRGAWRGETRGSSVLESCSCGSADGSPSTAGTFLRR